MTVIVMEKAPAQLRGELTRWLLETKPGVFVGKVSAAVRDRLWDKIIKSKTMVGALLLYSADTEQGFHMEMCGEPTRSIIDIEGIQLIKIQ